MRSSNRSLRQAGFLSLHAAYLLARPRRVLLYEPEASTRDRFARALRLAGYVVVDVESLEEAAGSLGVPGAAFNPVELPDLIIAQADEAAFSLLASLEAREHRPPALLLSDHADDAVQVEANRYRMAYVFLKPCTVEQIQSVACALVEP